MDLSRAARPYFGALLFITSVFVFSTTAYAQSDEIGDLGGEDAIVTISPSIVNISETIFTVTAEFVPTMNTTVVPTIAFTPNVSANLVAGTASWTNATHYVAQYTANLDFEQSNVLATVSNGADIDDNIIAAADSAFFSIDTKAPSIHTVAKVAAVTGDSTPNYILFSDEEGTLVFGGDCTSATTLVVTDNNTITFDPLSDGEHTNCTIGVTDAAGNFSGSLHIASFTVDTAKPVATLSLSAPGPFKSGDSVTVTANFNEDVGTNAGGTNPQVSLSGPGTNSLSGTDMAVESPASPQSFTYVLTVGSGDGTATVTVDSASDEALNVMTATTTTFTVDNTAPIITISNPTTAPAQSKTLTASISDGTLTMSVTTGSVCDSSLTFSAYSSNTFSTESDNGNKICHRGVDAAGNISYAFSNAIAGIDTTAPVITVTGSTSVQLTKGDSYTDAGATATDSVDGTVSVSSSGTVDTSTAGTYTITYGASDAAGNTAGASRTVTVVHACEDGRDNDADGLIDSADAGCHQFNNSTMPYEANDDDEFDPAPAVSSGGGGGGGGGGGPLILGDGGSNGKPVEGEVLGASTYVFDVDFGAGGGGGGGGMEDITQLQTILKSLGFYDGPINGIFGPLTTAAVIKFQKARGIEPATGYIGPKTRAALNEGSVPETLDAKTKALILQLKAKVAELLKQLLALLLSRSNISQ